MSAITDECAGLTQNMTWEEQKELLTRVLDAVERGDKALGDSLVKQLPVLPGLARLAFEWYGREHCETHFNLSAANRSLAKAGWMSPKRKPARHDWQNMNIVFDTNVILDVLGKRMPFAPVSTEAMAIVEREGFVGAMAANSISYALV